MKDDLISREDVERAIEETWDGCCSEYPPIEIISETQRSIDSIPSVPAVPLDKLCEWLERFAAMDCEGCREAFGSCEVSVCNSRERWKAMLTKWMEGLDAAD